MDSPFDYSSYVTGKNFVGRKQDVSRLAGLITQGSNVAIYAPGKSGKTSLLKQTLSFLDSTGIKLAVAQVEMMDLRSLAAFAERLAGALCSAVGADTLEQERLAQMLLDGGIEGSVRGTFAFAREKGVRLLVVFREFQNLEYFECGERGFKLMAAAMEEMASEGGRHCSYIFMGSCFNAMNLVFGVRKDFYKVAEVLNISQIEDKEIVEYFKRSFMTSGKVLEEEDLRVYLQIFRNNMWYLNHFIHICDSLSKGYINRFCFVEAIALMISVHEGKFMAMMNDLTNFQVSLLRAVTDGVKKFSTAEVIAQYSLNSSANVRRLKDALSKKEIVYFDENDRPLILDPLFEYWVKKYYFKNI